MKNLLAFAVLTFAVLAIVMPSYATTLLPQTIYYAEGYVTVYPAGSINPEIRKNPHPTVCHLAKDYLYDGINYTGANLSGTGDNPDLSQQAFDNMASSFIVPGKTVLDLYADKNYGGGWIHAVAAYATPLKVPNMGAAYLPIGVWTNHVSSLKEYCVN
jgi:hypothetical protein